MTTPPKPSARLKVNVVPGASRDDFVGWLGESLKIKVTAPPEKGRANEAVVEMLADRLGLSADDITVVTGHASPFKVIAINGMDDEMLKKSLGEPRPKTHPPERPSRNSVGWFLDPLSRSACLPSII